MATFPANELLFDKIPPDLTVQRPPLIRDHHYDNKATEHRFQYFLMGLDKLHDFGTHYDGVYSLIYDNHFLHNIPNQQADLMGRKIIRPESFVESNLKNKIAALHKLSDFNDKSGSPIVGRPRVVFRSYSDNPQVSFLYYEIQAPESIPSIKITDLHDQLRRHIYKQNIPDNRDVLLYFTGNKTDFQNPDSYEAFRDILGIEGVTPYVSRDAFPFNKETICGMLNKNSSLDFTSYTSELMDPATATKTILQDQAEINVLYCLLTGGKKLFLKALKNGDTIQLSFVLRDASGTESSTAQGNVFTITRTPTPPSIHDVVIELFRIDSEPKTPRSFTKTKSSICGKTVKFMNMLRTGNKNQDTRQQELLDHYFDPLYKAIPVPNGKTITYDDKKLIDIALKTIGDQTYIWDSLIYDAINPRVEGGDYKEGSYVVTVDKFLFDNIVWGKNSNAVFASKSNGGSVRDALLGSNYQVLIYLKPTAETEVEKQERREREAAAAAKAAEEEAARVAQMKNQYDTFKSERYAVLNEDATIYLSQFLDRRKMIVNLLIILFNSINPPEGRAQRNPKQYVLVMAVDEQGESTMWKDLIPAVVGNFYYSACYLLHFIIQTEISLFKILTHGEPTVEFDDIIDKQKEIDKINKIEGDMETAKTLWEDVLGKIGDLNILIDYLDKNPPTDPAALAPVAPDFNQLEESLDKNVERLKENLVNGMPHTVTVRNNYHLVKEKVIKYFWDFMPRSTSAGDNFITGGGKHSHLIKDGIFGTGSIFDFFSGLQSENGGLQSEDGVQSGYTTSDEQSLLGDTGSIFRIDDSSQGTPSLSRKWTKGKKGRERRLKESDPYKVPSPVNKKKGNSIFDSFQEEAKAEAQAEAEAIVAEAQRMLNETYENGMPVILNGCWGQVALLIEEINDDYIKADNGIKPEDLLTHNDPRTLELLEKLEIIKTTYYDPNVQSSDFYYDLYYDILLDYGPNILNSLIKNDHIAFDSKNESKEIIDDLAEKEKAMNLGGNKRKTRKKRRTKNTKKPKKRAKKQNKTKQTRKNKTRKSNN